MAPRSPLYVASNVVLRLVKEEEYYHKELEGQKKKIAKMEAGGASGDDENAEFVLKQEKQAMSETIAMFEPMREHLTEAVKKLVEQLALATDDGAEAEAKNGPSQEEVKAAELALEKGKAALRKGLEEDE